METTLAVVLFVPTMVITVLLFAAVIRRLLGVRVGLVRTVLAAVFALFVATPILQALAPGRPGEPGRRHGRPAVRVSRS